jgi:hypothetical protein
MISMLNKLLESLQKNFNKIFMGFKQYIPLHYNIT